MIELNDEIRDRLARAIDEQRTVSAAYVDVEGKPHLSFYGSTHVYSDRQLGLWVRNPPAAGRPRWTVGVTSWPANGSRHAG